MTVLIRKPYDKPYRVRTFFEGESLTNQADKKACDINNILKKAERTGVIEHLNAHAGQYGDFTTAEDYKASLDQILNAQDMFMSLPSNIRKKFDNDPAEFLAFVDDPANQEEMVSLGLAEPLPTSPDAGASPAPEPSPEGAAGSSEPAPTV